jgi:hypothetical protein
MKGALIADPEKSPEWDATDSFDFIGTATKTTISLESWITQAKKSNPPTLSLRIKAIVQPNSPTRGYLPNCRMEEATNWADGLLIKPHNCILQWA